MNTISWNDAVRLRPGMYVGALNNRGFIDTIKGIITNFLSKTKANRCTCTLLQPNSAALQFDNLKVPISENCAIIEGNPLESLAFELGALNALSEAFEVHFIDAEQNCFSKKTYKKGVEQGVTSQAQTVACSTVLITFQLDRTIWSDDFEWNESYIMHELENLAYLYPEAKFVINYQVDDETCKAIYHFKRGLMDRLKITCLNGHGRCLFATCIEEKINNFNIDVAFGFRQYSIDKCFIESYVNDARTVDHGTHIDGLVRGLTNGLRQYMQNRGLDGISEDAVLENLVAIMNIKIAAPSYGGSVKDQLMNEEIVEPIANCISRIVLTKLEGQDELVNLFHGAAQNLTPDS